MSQKSSTDQSNFLPLTPFMYTNPRGSTPRPRPRSVPLNNQFTVLGQIPPISSPSIPPPFPPMTSTFSQKVSSSSSSSSSSTPVNTKDNIIAKSYIRHLCYIEDPYQTLSDPYQIASQILPPNWNYVPRNPMFTQSFYQHILIDTKSVEIEQTQCKYDPMNIGFSKFTIRRIISSKEWGQPWTLRALAEPFRNLKHITYYDYIDAWTFTLFFDNKTHRHTWFIRFKGFQCPDPIPHWFTQWWDRFGADINLFPPAPKQAYDK